jgi:hypothetical protein
MIFCGQCGYQLAPGEEVCPRCGTRAPANPLTQGSDAYHPTEISHAVLESPRLSAPQRAIQPRQPTPSEPAGPLVLGADYPNEQMANEATKMMSSQMYTPQQSYTGYPQQSGYAQQRQQDVYAYNPAASYQQQQYQASQAATLAAILASSRKGRTNALLLILFGLILLIGAIIVFLLTIQGIIFAA